MMSSRLRRILSALTYALAGAPCAVVLNGIREELEDADPNSWGPDRVRSVRARTGLSLDGAQAALEAADGCVEDIIRENASGRSGESVPNEVHTSNGMNVEVLKKTWVVAYLWNERGETLVRRRGPGRFEGMWECPGGKARVGETLEEAVLRELREETGLVGSDPRHLVSYDTPGGVAHYFRIPSWTGGLKHERGHGSWQWLTPAMLEDECRNGEVFGTLSTWWGIPHPRVRPIGGE